MRSMRKFLKSLEQNQKETAEIFETHNVKGELGKFAAHKA